jgi:hypothetical protein
MEQHKQMIRDLMQGKLEIQTPAQQPAPPAPKGEVDENGLDDIIHDFLTQEQKGQGQKK